MELPDFLAALRDHEDALREHETRVGAMLAAHQPALAPSPRGAAAPNDGEPDAVQVVLDERNWWSEAMVVQMQQLRAFLSDELRKTAVEVQGLQASCAQEIQKVSSGVDALQRVLGREPELGPQALAFASPRLDEQLEQSRREQQESDARLLGQLEQQGASLRDLSLGVAGLRGLLQPAPAEDGEATEDISYDMRRTSTTVEPGDVCHVEARWRSMPDGSLVPSSTESRTVPAFRHRAQEVCHSHWFICVTAFAIVANCILIGVETNEDIKNINGHSEYDLVFQVLDWLFILVFVAEISIRWVSHGTSFLKPGSSHFIWNVFDFVLVALTIVEEVLEILSVNLVVSVLFLRLARLLRLAKMLRMFKAVREFKELRTMVNGVLSCARPLLWALVLIASLTYMTAVFMLQICSDYLRNLPDTTVAAHSSGQAEPDEVRAVDFINERFSSIGWAMYELFKSLTGGSDWGDTADPLWDISFLIGVAYLLYVVLGMFCMLNLITAVFLEAADGKNEVQEEAYAKRDWINEAVEFFSVLVHEGRIDHEDGSTIQLTKDEFISVLNHRKSLIFLQENGVDLFLDGDGRLEELFTLMDADGSGTIDMNEFVSSLYKLKGAARSLDAKLEHQQTIAMLDALQDSVRQLRRNLKSPKAGRPVLFAQSQSQSVVAQSRSQSEVAQSSVASQR